MDSGLTKSIYQYTIQTSSQRLLQLAIARRGRTLRRHRRPRRTIDNALPLHYDASALHTPLALSTRTPPGTAPGDAALVRHTSPTTRQHRPPTMARASERSPTILRSASALHGGERPTHAARRRLDERATLALPYCARFFRRSLVARASERAFVAGRRRRLAPFGHALVVWWRGVVAIGQLHCVATRRSASGRR